MSSSCLLKDTCLCCAILSTHLYIFGRKVADTLNDFIPQLEALLHLIVNNKRSTLTFLVGCDCDKCMIYDSRSRLYTIWRCMKTRCLNKNAKNYSNYGGRGIDIFDGWKNNYKAFRLWALSNDYADDLSIDRIDNNRGYYPENCRFVTTKQQARNRRSNRIVHYQKNSFCVAEFAEMFDLTYGFVYRKASRCFWNIPKYIVRPAVQLKINFLEGRQLTFFN